MEATSATQVVCYVGCRNGGGDKGRAISARWRDPDGHTRYRYVGDNGENTATIARSMMVCHEKYKGDVRN